MSRQDLNSRAMVYEKKFIPFEKWGMAPLHVLQEARMSSNEGVPTGIGWDEDLGWFIIHSGQGPYFAFIENEKKVLW